MTLPMKDGKPDLSGLTLIKKTPTTTHKFGREETLEFLQSFLDWKQEQDARVIHNLLNQITKDYPKLSSYGCGKRDGFAVAAQTIWNQGESN